jgi:SAM-dependent methyltransferase
MALAMAQSGHGDPSPKRVCPACTARTPLMPGERLWPAAWLCTECGKGPDVADGFVRLAPELDGRQSGYDNAAFDLLFRVEEQHFWFVARNALIIWLVECHAPAATRVLEIGCGTGFVLKALAEALPQAALAGSELQTVGLAHARLRHSDRVELLQMDARRPGLDQALDLVGAFDVLEHIPEDEAVLSALARALKPGGILMATVPQHPFLWSTADDLAHHQRRYRRGELAAKCRAAGLEIVATTSFVTLPFPLMLVSRMIERLKPRPKSLDQQIADEFAIPQWQNRLLTRLLAFEHRLRKAGVPLPFGGSQVVVARRPVSALQDRTA